jgi:hypothetical protein
LWKFVFESDTTEQREYCGMHCRKIHTYNILVVKSEVKTTLEESPNLSGSSYKKGADVGIVSNWFIIGSCRVVL